MNKTVLGESKGTSQIVSQKVQRWELTLSVYTYKL